MRQKQNDNLFMSVVVSLLVSLPAFGTAVYVMETNIAWAYPAIIVLSILALGAANFAAIVFLEHYRENIGSLTLPALLATVGLILLFVVAESVNRFVRDFGYGWLFPVLVLALALSFLAIFKEGKVLLKCQLGFNSMALAVLWALGSADKIVLPF